MTHTCLVLTTGQVEFQGGSGRVELNGAGWMGWFGKVTKIIYFFQHTFFLGGEGICERYTIYPS